MEQSKLNKILDDHKLWLKTGGKQGERANLRSADLSSANLSYANLHHADLQYADLRSADLSYADLRSADLRSADLRSADLRCANLDFSVFPLWCGGLSVHIDDKQAKQLLYHLLRNIYFSKNITTPLKKLLLTKTLVREANEFHRAEECGYIFLEKEGKRVKNISDIKDKRQNHNQSK